MRCRSLSIVSLDQCGRTAWRESRTGWYPRTGRRGMLQRPPGAPAPHGSGSEGPSAGTQQHPSSSEHQLVSHYAQTCLEKPHVKSHWCLVCNQHTLAWNLEYPLHIPWLLSRRGRVLHANSVAVREITSTCT